MAKNLAVALVTGLDVWYMLAALTTKNVKVEDVVSPFLGFLVRLLNTFDSSHSPPPDFICVLLRAVA